MKTRNVSFELEAKLKGKSGRLFNKPSGKLERKTYDDGTERLKISIRNLKLPGETVAQIKYEDEMIAEVTLHNGSGRYDLESSEPGKLPTLTDNNSVQVIINGNVALWGKLYRD